jgi:hypothetical protein
MVIIPNHAPDLNLPLVWRQVVPQVRTWLCFAVLWDQFCKGHLASEVTNNQSFADP